VQMINSIGPLQFYRRYATQEVQNQAGMNLTPPPPSQNCHVVRWHCTASSKRRVAEIKSRFPSDKKVCDHIDFHLSIACTESTKVETCDVKCMRLRMFTGVDRVQRQRLHVFFEGVVVVVVVVLVLYVLHTQFTSQDQTRQNCLVSSS